MGSPRVRAVVAFRRSLVERRVKGATDRDRPRQLPVSQEDLVVMVMGLARPVLRP